jgi:hypothetical protein
MKIVFYRQGFPNNSSSSHGIVLASTFDAPEDRADGRSFNWEHFVLRSRKAKEEYLFVALRESVGEYLRCSVNLAWEYRADVEKVIFGRLLKETRCFQHLDDMIEYGIEDGNIDHQSTLSFPMKYKSSGEAGVLDMQFFNAFCEEVLSDKYVIHGGNDNSDPPWNTAGTPHPLYQLLGSSVPKFSIYDPLSKDFIILVPSSGDELRVNFQGRSAAVKGSFPTLVDVCIGSFCDKGCKFCYQGSNASGTFADHNQVSQTIRELISNNTINIVLGGGEPTRHPDLVKILEFSKGSAAVAFSITTRNYTWHNEPGFTKCAKIIKSVAISCNSVDDLRDATPLAVTLAAHGVHVSFQNIIGLQSEFDLQEYFDELADISRKSDFHRNVGVTLLGWKATERGASGPAYDLKGMWVSMAVAFNKATGIAVSADASLTSSHNNDLIRAGVEYFRISAQEGMYSCYIDVQEKYIRKCSYEGTKMPLYDKGSQWVDGKHLLTMFAKL